MEGVRFGEPQVVARAGAGGQVVGICMGPGPAQVTCTLVPLGVQIVDVNSATCVLSWSLKGRSPLLSAVVVGAGERLVLACEDGAVLSWNAKETTDLGRADVLKGKGRAAKLQALLVEPSLDAVLLVYTDGHVRMMRPDLSQELCSTTLLLPKDNDVIFADLARAGADSYLAVVLTRGADGSTNACRWRLNCASDGNGFSMSKAKWDPLQPPGSGAGGDGGANGAALLTCALHRPPTSSTAQPTLSVVWDSLVWQRFRVGTGGHPTLEASFQISGITAGPRRAAGVRGKSTSLAFATGVVAATVHSDYLVVIGRGGGDKADTAAVDQGGSVNCLTAWDSLYGTKQGVGHLRWSADDSDVAHYSSDATRAARASQDGSLLAVALEKCVVVCGMQSTEMSLDMVVAAAASARETSRPHASCAMRPVDVMACIAMAVDTRHEASDTAACTAGGVVAAEAPRTRLAQAIQEGNRREGAILSQIKSDSKGTKWVEAVKLYLEDLQAECVNTEAARRAFKPQSAARRPASGSSGTRKGGGSVGRAVVRVAVSEEVVDAVIRRCTERQQESKADEALLGLVQAGAVSMRAHPALLGFVIESGNLVVLESILKHVPDLLEHHLLACLKLILLHIRKQSMDVFITTWAAAAPETPVLDHDAVRRHLLDLVMLAPRDHWPLVKELKKLSLQEAVRLLRYCQSLYKMHGVAANVQLLKPHKSSRTPHLRCVVEWITAVLDAHFTALVLAPECHSLLKELKELTKAETALAKETLSLDGLLMHVLQNKPLPVKPMRQYSVETLFFPL